MPDDPMVEAILDPMRELLGRYRAASERLAEAMAALEVGLSGGHGPVGPVNRSEPPSTRTRLETQPSDVGTLLDFQERLSEIPGVLKVTVAGTAEQGSTFLIELAPEPQLTVCTSCGKTLVEGHPPASHGLCDGCRAVYGAPRG